MNLNLGQLTGTLFVFFSCLGLSAQEVGVVMETPIMAPQVMQTFTYNNGLSTEVMSVPMVSYYGFGGGNGLNSLHDPSVMRDLELLDDQISKITEIRGQYSKQLQRVMKEFSKPAEDLTDKEKQKKYQEDMKQVQAEQSDALSAVLLPHQLARVKQVATQMQMQAMGGPSSALQHGQLAKELDISEEQKKKLAEIQKKMREDIAAKTKEIQIAAKKKVLDQLTATQKMKLDELTGEEFVRNPKDWQEHRQRTYTRREKN